MRGVFLKYLIVAELCCLFLCFAAGNHEQVRMPGTHQKCLDEILQKQIAWRIP